MATATKQDEARKAVLAELDRLTGNLFNSEDIVFEGSQLKLPQSMSTIREGITFLELKEQELKSRVDWSRKLPYKAWDVAYAMQRLFQRQFGGSVLKGQNIFSNAALIDVKVGVNEVVQVPWGEFVIPILPEVTFGIEATRDPELGTVGMIYASGPKNFTGRVSGKNGIFDLIEDELRAHSIYKGKAIDGQDMPNFIDVEALDESKIVYSDQVLADLEAHLFGPMRYPEAFREEGIPIKKAVLLEGKFGVGKTLALKLAGKVAVTADQPWTFIMVKPGRDSIEDAIRMGRMYGPAIVAFEDVDTVANAEEESERISMMLDLFDGMDAKGQDVMVVLTTNYVETLHSGMLRPGRLDKIIEIGELDVNGVQKLVEVSLKPGRLAENIDWKRVHAAVEGYLPAFIVAVANGSISYAISRSQGSLNGHQITTEDLVFAGEGYRRQFELQQGAKTGAVQPKLDSALEEVVKHTLVKMLDPRILNDEEVS